MKSLIKVRGLTEELAKHSAVLVSKEKDLNAAIENIKSEGRRSEWENQAIKDVRAKAMATAGPMLTIVQDLKKQIDVLDKFWSDKDSVLSRYPLGARAVDQLSPASEVQEATLQTAIIQRAGLMSNERLAIEVQHALDRGEIGRAYLMIQTISNRTPQAKIAEFNPVLPEQVRALELIREAKYSFSIGEIAFRSMNGASPATLANAKLTAARYAPAEKEK